MKPVFKQRLLLSVIIVLVFSILNTLCKHWIFSSIGFCICGLLYIIRPVKMNDFHSEEKQFTECRIAGIILILLGIMLRAKFY